MRGLFGLVGLLLALVVAGLVVRQQLRTLKTPVAALQIQPVVSTEVPASSALSATPATGNVMQQSQQIQQQVKQAVEGAIQARPMSDDQ